MLRIVCPDYFCYLVELEAIHGYSARLIARRYVPTIEEIIAACDTKGDNF